MNVLSASHFLAGDGDMATRLRAFDWTSTPLGGPDGWSAGLQSMVGMALAARQPVLILWGAERRCLYNDAFRAVLGDERHPCPLGQMAASVWADRWPVVAPVLARAMAGDALTADDLRCAGGLFDAGLAGRRGSCSLSGIYDAGEVAGLALIGNADVPEPVPTDGVSRLGETDVDLVLEATDAGFFEFDLRSGVVQLSDKSVELFGCAIRAPTALDLLERVHPDDREALRSALTGSPRVDSFRLTLRIYPSPNDLRYVRVAGRHGRGGSAGAAGVFWDVTEHRMLVDTLRTADRRKDEFLATLAHELRNPLAALRSAAYLVTREGVSPERLRWCGEVIQRQSKAMAQLLDDLMDVSRITRGKVELRLEPVELKTVVDAALETAGPAFEARRHRLEVELLDPPVRFEADPLRLTQVLTHLLANAARYTEPGGVVRLNATLSAAGLRIEVSDNGTGIAPEHLPTLFEMFHPQRAAARTGGTGGGLGIGLSVSKGLVELHGGRLDAASPGLGHGSTFTVTLPLQTVPAVAGADADGPTILVADDNADAAEATAALLRMEGYTVEVAYDGQGAFEAARLCQPFAAFLDIGMPGMTGYRLATEIRRQPWGRDLLLVAVSGWGQGADRDRATEAGFDMHLTKPVDPERVTALLAKARTTRRRSG